MGKISMEKFLSYKKIKDIENIITDKQYVEINKLFSYYNTQTIKNRLQNIRCFILNNVETNWLGRLRIITRKLKNDILSDYACKIRYGDKWKENQDILKDKVRMDKNNFIKKYGIEEGIKRWEERNQKVISYGLKPAISRYGEEEGRKRWERTLKQKIETMSKVKKIRPYRNGRTLTEYQQRYGVELGYNNWIKRNEKQSYRFNLKYYIDKYGESEGIKEWDNYCNSMNKTTQDSFIKKYGVEVGNERYLKFVDRIKYTQSEEYFIEKYGEIDGVNKYKEVITSKISQFKDKYSKISQDLFWGIFEKLSNEDRKKCFFYEYNNEYSFYVWENKMTIICVDFKLGNKIIEFDGDYWHSKNKQIEIDNKRDDFLKKKGYIIKRVKENDYRTNKEILLRECLTFLKNG